MALAALLLNNFRKKKRDADANPVKRYVRPDEVYDKESRQQAILTAARRLEELTEGVTTPPAAKPVREVIAQVEQYADNETDTQGLSDLLARLAALEFELRQEILKQTPEQVTYLAILEQISVVLTFVRDDEEAILAILLCEA